MTSTTTVEQDERAERFEEALYSTINPKQRRKGGPMATTTRQQPPKKKRPKPKKKTPKPKKKGKKKRTAGTDRGFCGMSPLKLVLYGPSGVGKTSFGANFPRPGFIIDPQEEGIRTLAGFNIVPEPVFIEQAEDFEGTLAICGDIAAGKWDIQTACFDSITGFEKLCFAFHCEEYFEGDWSSEGFYSYQRGPKNAAKTAWPRFLNALDDIRAAGINVLLIGHSRTKLYNNPEGADYDHHVCYSDPETWSAIHRWAQGVLFYNYLVELDLSKKKGPRTKAKQEGEGRIIYTEWAPAFDAKNWFELDPVIDGGESAEESFKNFEEAFRKASTDRVPF